jgi:hypothetical protein
MPRLAVLKRLNGKAADAWCGSKTKLEGCLPYAEKVSFRKSAACRNDCKNSSPCLQSCLRSGRRLLDRRLCESVYANCRRRSRRRPHATGDDRKGTRGRYTAGLPRQSEQGECPQSGCAGLVAARFRRLLTIDKAMRRWTTRSAIAELAEWGSSWRRGCNGIVRSIITLLPGTSPRSNIETFS